RGYISANVALLFAFHRATTAKNCGARPPRRLPSRVISEGAIKEISADTNLKIATALEAYIKKNDDFLRSIDCNVPKEVIERWLLRRRTATRIAYNPTQKAIFLDGSFVFMTTNERCYSHEQVLWELGRCISTAVAVDGFRVYQVTFDHQLNIQLVINSEETNQVKLIMVPTSEAPVVEHVVDLGHSLCLSRAHDSEKFKGPICSE
ncbi:hypothetical protein EVAR_74134_1, partial [Eumeta japonica]